jgi:hypothetical protein
LKMTFVNHVSISKSATICCNNGIKHLSWTVPISFDQKQPFSSFFVLFFFERKMNLILFQGFSIFGIETGWSLCHLVRKKCNTVPTVQYSCSPW